MSNKTYVIRSYQFGYNDECYYVCGSRINSIYKDKLEAEKNYKALQVGHIKNANLSEESSIFDAEAGFITKLDAFIFEKTGTHIAENSDYLDYGVELPANMSDDEILEFGKLAHISAYRLVEFDDKPIFYALWDTKEKEYKHDYDECYEGLSYAESQEGALKELEDWIYDKDWEKIKLIQKKFI